MASKTRMRGRDSSGAGEDEQVVPTTRGRVRRIIAEENEWSLSVVPTLRECVLKCIVRGFASRPIFRELNVHDQTYVVNHLPADTPIKATANLIDDESYWKRCCRRRWPTADIANHGRSWKRMYFEKHVAEYLESHVPATPEDAQRITEMKELLMLCANHVECLNLRQLLPPITSAPEPKRRKRRPRQAVPPAPGSTGNAEEQKEDSESDEEDLSIPDVKMDHFDIGIALKLLPRLKSLSVVYQVRNVGMNFDWSLFQFTRRDCAYLSRALENCSSLVELRLTKSCLDDHRARLLHKYLRNHRGLQILDLSFNKIGDRGIKALSKLLHHSSPVPLVNFNLADNLITEEGGIYMGLILQHNSRLKSLSLRLNNLCDRGAESFFISLRRNDCLEKLCMSASSLTIDSATGISDMLEKNTGLRELDISCNTFGIEGGKILYEGLTANPSLTVLDLRLCGVGQENEYQISQILKRNMEDQGILPTL